MSAHGASASGQKRTSALPLITRPNRQALGLLSTRRNNINGSSFLVWAVLLSGTDLSTSSRHRGHFMDRPARGRQGRPRGGRVQSLTAPASRAALIAPPNCALKDGNYDAQGVRDCTHHWPIQASLCRPIPFNAATRPGSRSRFPRALPLSVGRHDATAARATPKRRAATWAGFGLKRRQVPSTPCTHPIMLPPCHWVQGAPPLLGLAAGMFCAV